MEARTRQNNEEARLIDRTALQAFLSLGKNSAVEYARSIGAERRFGKRVLYDKVVINAALDKAEAGGQL